MGQPLTGVLRPLPHYLALWNLRDPEPLAQTPRSDVYTVTRKGTHGDDRVVLKLLTAEGAEDEDDGALALQYYGGNGAVRLLDRAEGAHLMEYAGDEELAEVVWRGDDLDAAAIIADVLNKLHAPRPGVPVPAMRTLRRRFRDLFRQAERDQAAGDNSIYVRGARMAEHLLTTAHDEVILHGDMQHHNVRRHPERGWLAYDAKGLFGERTYDAANTLCNPCNASALVTSEARFLAVSDVLAKGMGLPVGRLRAFVFAYACLSVVWSGVDDTSSATRETLIVAQFAEPHALPDML